MPLGYEVFAGNTADVTTVEHIVEIMEQRYGKSDRIWVMDRGMVSEENIEFLKQEGRRYIIGATKSHLKKFEQQLLAEDWHTVHAGVEVKLCQSPDGDEETFILCRSRDRRKKDEAIVRRFEQRIEDRLKSMRSRCEKQNRNVQKVEREVGRLLGQNTRAAGLFDVEVKADAQGFAKLTWKKVTERTDWATLSAGCYLLRSNVKDWSDEDLWKAYIQLTEAEAAFRIHKSDLSIRPIWHQKEGRVLAHILVCFLVQQFERRHFVKRFAFRAGRGNHALALLLRRLVVERQLAWYPGCGTVAGESPDASERDDLETELSSLVLRQSTGGHVRIDHTADGRRHDDRSFALGAACLELLDGAADVEYMEIRGPRSDGGFDW